MTKTTIYEKKNWTEAETTYLMENYPAISDTVMAARLGVSRRTLSNKAHELGLDKGINPEWLERAEKVRGLYSSRSYTEIALETGIPYVPSQGSFPNWGLTVQKERRTEYAHV